MPERPTATAAGAAMRAAATEFANSLNVEQRATTIYDYMDGERIFWYYPPTNRHGLPLRDMTDAQRGLAMDLMKAGLSARAYEQAVGIIDLEIILGEIELGAGRKTFKRDPELYYWTIFGDPADDETPWGWRVEGHHISLNYSLWGDGLLALTPFFFGTNPAEVRSGPQTGLRILDQREDLAFDLMAMLDAEQSERTVIYPEAPWDILTFNASRAVMPAYEGLAASEMDDDQRAVLDRLINVYVDQAPSDLAEDCRGRIAAAGREGMHFAWAGPVQSGEPHYYRIHGGNFLVEFDNRQNGANHIHSVWRDVENDFANDVLGDHLILYHVL
ncbi:MAG: DUF3500 domain-containing protein [Chloroflexota bacterium]|nr:DUF3500 domain-containing protein [Chloroflexota bacterium]MDE2896358.1 DUF3500 domain-containing protein [Chloroflexota bacterium]